MTRSLGNSDPSHGSIETTGYSSLDRVAWPDGSLRLRPGLDPDVEVRVQALDAYRTDMGTFSAHQRAFARYPQVSGSRAKITMATERGTFIASLAGELRPLAVKSSDLACSPDTADMPVDCPALRLLLIAPFGWLSELLTIYLSTIPDIGIVGRTGTAAEGLATATAARPRLVLVDAGLPGGQDCVSALCAMTAARILVLGQASTPSRRAEWAAAGAAAHLDASLSLDQLVDTLRFVAAGRRPFAVELSGTATLRGDETQGAALSLVTAREHDVIRLVAAGLSNKEIARTLGVSLATIKTHVHNVLVKLKLQRRAQVASWASMSQVGETQDRFAR